MKKDLTLKITFTVIALGLLALGVSASNIFRDGIEGYESNSTHFEGNENEGEDSNHESKEKSESNHSEGNDFGNNEGKSEGDNFRDGAEGYESNSTHAEGNENEGNDK